MHVGETSDNVIKDSYSLMAQLEDIDRKMILVHNASKRVSRISGILDVLETKIYNL
jgi:hypothetical protein